MDGQVPATNDSESAAIPRPYLPPEQSETFPLKKVAPRESCGGSLRVIVTCFFVLTLAISIALAAQIHLGDYQLVPHGSVASDSHECSVIGTDILKQGGNSVDAAVASTFCMGVINPHVTGIGGGGFVLIYNHRKQKVLDAIDFRETSPGVAAPPGAAGLGLHVGVPGLVRGLALAHQLHGVLSWKDVVMPSVKIARSGFLISESLVAANSKLTTSDGFGNEKLREFMKPLEQGQIHYSPKLAGTLELIASVGPDVLYNGSLALQILSAVSEAGGSLTLRDLAEYLPVRRGPLITHYAGFRLFMTGAPFGGPLLQATLNHLNISQETTSPIQVALAIQQTLTSQAGQWGDPDSTAAGGQPVSASEWNIPEAVGSHVAAIDSDDLYVSVVSGLNTWFGSQLLTDGEFLLNNALVNFGSGSNTAGPSKRPLSLATPIIAVEEGFVCGRRLVLGAGDFSVAAQLLVQLISRSNNITIGVNAPRFRLSNNKFTLGLEPWHKPTFSQSILDGLKSLGFQLLPLTGPYQSCNVVEKIADDLSSNSDQRGKGVASRF